MREFELIWKESDVSSRYLERLQWEQGQRKHSQIGWNIRRSSAAFAGEKHFRGLH
jgi:hypothetical protein